MGVTSAARFVLYEGDTRNLPFQLRRRGIKGGWDVSTALSIVLGVTDPDGLNLTPIGLLDGFAGATWVTGFVVAPVSIVNVTGKIGTWGFAVTVAIGTETITSSPGVIEVLDRPGFALP